jgi:tRNA dimethylallyltransferase
LNRVAAPGPLLFLVGPTAAGKKRVALAVAERLGAELLALDSMKVYRGMDVGTDKASAGRFLLTDLVEPDQPFSVGAYVRAAAAAVAEVRARGKSPLFVGGTGLYLRALVGGLFEVPDVTGEVRAAVGAEIDAHGVAAAHAELARVDPAAARRLHPTDRRRIARALEVARQTGRPLSAWQAESTRRPIEGRPILVGLAWSRAKLKPRIEARVQRMVAGGLIEEVKALRAARRIGPVAGLAIGYREVVAMLDAGTDASLVARAIVADTWSFMRRQENWFRQFPEIVWVDADRDFAAVTNDIEAAFRTAQST